MADQKHIHDPEDAPPPYTETDLFSSSERVLTPTTSQASESVAESPREPSRYAVPEPSQAPSAGSGASAYFAARPMLSPLPETLITNTIALNPNSKPADFPLPDSLKVRDVTAQDWAIFLNYLMPHHIFDNNAEVAGRKFSAQLASEHLQRNASGDNAESVRGATGTDRDDRTDLDSLVSAQFDSLSVNPKTTSLSSVTDEWNRCFFTPRGIFIRVNDDSHPPEPSRPGTFRLGKDRVVADERGFRIGNRVVADENGFRIGNFLVADSNGFRLGGIVADEHGLRIGGRSLTGDARRGRPPGRYPNDGERHGRGRHGSRGFHRGGRGGFGGFGGHHGRRDSSTSSSSSSSSTSSSSSSSSDDSMHRLPDLDKFNERQLEVTKRFLNDWLSHPEHPISRTEISQLKTDVKSAKGQPAMKSADYKALRTEVKAMMTAFKSVKKAQKQQRRTERRQRMAEKKAAKRERRALRQAAKREKRNVRNAERRERKDAKQERKRAEREAQDCRYSTREPAQAGPSSPGVPFPLRNVPPHIARQHPSRGFHHPVVHPPHITLPHIDPSHPPPFPQFPGFATQGRAPGDAVQNHIQHLNNEAGRISSDADRMQEEVDRTKVEAKNLGEEDPKSRLKLLDVADGLQEEVEKLRRESDRLRAEAQHIESEMFRGNTGQSSGVTL